MDVSFAGPARIRAAQDRALRRYVAQEVAPFSALHGSLLAGVTVDDRAGLARLPVMSLSDVRDAGDAVLRPTEEAIRFRAPQLMRWRFRLAKLQNRLAHFDREVLQPRYKPIHWHDADGVPIGYTAVDLAELAEIGRLALELAGVQRDDVLLGLIHAGPTVEYWQLALGAHRAGVSSYLPGPALEPVDAARLRPTVLAGSGATLVALLEQGHREGRSFDDLRTLLVVGEPLEEGMRARLRAAAGHDDLGVVAMWAPPGVRAMWTECRSGTDVHLWPTREIVEIVDGNGHTVPAGEGGEVVWTPVGWLGSVVLRLRTGVRAALEETACPSCGRTTPRLRVLSALPPFAAVLDHHPAVRLWQAELRTVAGVEELIVHLAVDAADHPGPLLRELDQALNVTQFVVTDHDTLVARMAEHEGHKVIDRRQ